MQVVLTENSGHPKHFASIQHPCLLSPFSRPGNWSTETITFRRSHSTSVLRLKFKALTLASELLPMDRNSSLSTKSKVNKCSLLLLFASSFPSQCLNVHFSSLLFLKCVLRKFSFKCPYRTCCSSQKFPKLLVYFIWQMDFNPEEFWSFEHFLSSTSSEYSTLKTLRTVGAMTSESATFAVRLFIQKLFLSICYSQWMSGAFYLLSGKGGIKASPWTSGGTGQEHPGSSS